MALLEVSKKTLDQYCCQEAAVIVDAPSLSTLYVRVLGGPELKRVVRIAYPKAFSPDLADQPATLAVVQQQMEKLVDRTGDKLALCKLLVNESTPLDGNKPVEARVFLTFGCRVNPNHPAGPVIERLDRGRVDHYIDLGAYLYYSTLHALGDDREAQQGMIGRRNYWIKSAIKHPGALRARARHMHLLQGKHDTLSSRDLARLAKAASKTATLRDDRQVALARRLKHMRRRS